MIIYANDEFKAKESKLQLAHQQYASKMSKVTKYKVTHPHWSMPKTVTKSLMVTSNGTFSSIGTSTPSRYIFSKQTDLGLLLYMENNIHLTVDANENSSKCNIYSIFL